jgi:hypothetical protein
LRGMAFWSQSDHVHRRTISAGRRIQNIDGATAESRMAIMRDIAQIPGGLRCNTEQGL